MAAIAATFQGMFGPTVTMATVIPAPQQPSGDGFLLHSVDRDGDRWQVDFQAGGRMYRYTTTPADQSLQVCSGSRWATIAEGIQTPGEIAGVLYNMAGLGIGFYTFRWGYEQWYAGRVAGWCECDTQSRAGLDF